MDTLRYFNCLEKLESKLVIDEDSPVSTSDEQLIYGHDRAIHLTALDVEYFDWVRCICIEDINIVFSIIDEKEVIAYGLNMLYFVTFNPMNVRWRSILSVQVLEIPHLL